MKNIYQNYYDRKIKYMSMTGVFAALITLMTAYICHVPIGANGGYLHLGDAFIYLAAAMLPAPYALAAAGIGGGLADLLTAPAWTPATVIIKMLVASLFTCRGTHFINRRNVAATAGAYLISGVGYYMAEYVLFEKGAVFAVTMVQTIVQSLGSAVVFIVFGLALDRAGMKKRFL